MIGSPWYLPKLSIGRNRPISEPRKLNYKKYDNQQLPPGAKPRTNEYFPGPGIRLYGNAASHSGSDFTFTAIYQSIKDLYFQAELNRYVWIIRILQSILIYLRVNYGAPSAHEILISTEQFSEILNTF